MYFHPLQEEIGNMSEEEISAFLSDMDQVIDQILAGELVEEGLLSYGGVGAEEDAPKWLLSAVEIFEEAAHDQ